MRLAVLALGAYLALASLPGGAAPEFPAWSTADRHGQHREAARPDGRLRVILQESAGAGADALIGHLGGTAVRRLEHVGAMVADVPAEALAALGAAVADGRVVSFSVDRPLRAALDRTVDAVGARWVHDQLGFDGTGVGVGIIDSGITTAHAGLGADRVVHFADFVDFRPEPYDGYGHGTHVAGIIASRGTVRGIAPGADLIVLRTLDHEGRGYISDAVAAIDYAIAQRAIYNIRVINLSVTAGVYESYRTDPLALAAARAVDAGMVVVTAAGNLGRNAAGDPQYGSVTAPGNAPWVLTVGAGGGELFDSRAGDVAPFSSLGPSSIDFVEKPDLIAPGTDIVSLADPDGTLFLTRPGSRRYGDAGGQAEPYLSLSGTSMAAPVVAGGVAVLVQANPGLSPDGVKAILKATADPLDGYSRLAQGAGRLNLRAAVALAAGTEAGMWRTSPRGEVIHR